MSLRRPKHGTVNSGELSGDQEKLRKLSSTLREASAERIYKIYQFAQVFLLASSKLSCTDPLAVFA